MAPGVAQRIVVGVVPSPDGRELRLHYRLDGDIGRLLLPAPSAPRRADRLWQHTCFEAFLRPVGQESYCEFNFSPSGEWAAWHFTTRRAGMQELEVSVPAMRYSRYRSCIELDVKLDTGAWTGTADLGLAAVVEDHDGSLAYWALSHAGNRPDFHDPKSFRLRLDPTQIAVTAGDAT